MLYFDMYDGISDVMSWLSVLPGSLNILLFKSKEYRKHIIQKKMFVS